MVQTKNISYSIGSKIILENININFEPGKLHLIIGPNGAGKSTLIKLLSKQLSPNAGTISLAGRNINNYTVQELAKNRAVLSQNIDLAFPLKVHEVVMMGRYPHFTIKPSAKDYEACKAAMQFFDVEEMAERDFLSLSGGEQQRVHFARVLAQIWFAEKNTCRYLLLDEPLTFLDVHYQFQFMHKIQALLKQPNLVIIGVVHDLNLAAKFADQIVLINNTKVLANGTHIEVLTKENIKEAYFLEPIIHQTEMGLQVFFG